VIRARESDADVFDEAARRLGCRQRDAITLAAVWLAKELGIDRDLVASIGAALAREYGDDAVITATFGRRLVQLCRLTIFDQPLQGFTGYAAVAIDPTGRALSSAALSMVHDATRTHFALGTIDCEDVVDGASVEVRVGELADHWKPPQQLSAATKQQVKQQSELRAQARQQRGEDEDD
jgi:hypothetical protein